MTVELEQSLSRSFSGRRVLVTGHTGFKGGWLVHWLKRLGAEVCGYALEPPTDPSLFEASRVAEVADRSVIADIRHREEMADTFASFRPEIVFHLAAQSIVRVSYAEPKLTFDTNVGGSVNVFECVRDTSSVRVLVNITSDKCYDNKGWVWGYRENDPMGGKDPYSASKGAAELAFAAYLSSYFAARPDLGAASVRAGNVVGGGDWGVDRLVPDAMRALANGEAVPVRNPHATRPWQHVLEPLAGYLLLSTRLLDSPARFSGAWNFGPGPESARTVRELVEAVLENWGSGRWVDRGDLQEGAPPEEEFLHLCSDKARMMLGWRPRWDFARSVRETVRWYKAHAEGRDMRRVTENQLEQYISGA